MNFPGISVITVGPALGHDCFVDQITLEQVAALGNQGSPVKVVPDHVDSVQGLFGSMANFVIDGEHVRADLTVIKEHPMAEYYDKILNLFPEAIGFSIDCSQTLEEIAGKQYLRLNDLYNVSLVMEPAANPGGVFSARTKPARKLKASPNPLPFGPSDPPAKDPLPVIEHGGEEGLGVDTGKKDMSNLDAAAPAESTPAASPTEALTAALSKALEPIHEALKALHAKLDEPTVEGATVTPNSPVGGDLGDASTMPGGDVLRELSALRNQLSALSEANRGTAPVEEALTPETLAEKYAAISDLKERAKFARAHAKELRAILPRPFQK